MTFISRNTRVFDPRRSDDINRIELGGKLRVFEETLDPRCWSLNCFERHDYLFELLAEKKTPVIETDESFQPREGLALRSRAGLAEGPSASGDMPNRSIGTSCSSLESFLHNEGRSILNSQRSFLDVDDSPRSLENPKFSVNISRGVGLETCVRITGTHGKADSIIRRLEAKLLRTLTENAMLRRELEIVKESKTPYIEKIQSDLNKYLEVCARQKRSISSLRRELEIMQEELAKLHRGEF